ncbi:MAG: hypothetical protein KFKLKKLM_02274 [Flavobacteriales bacterium]|nr:hypothetical protein [Flavobacteriales bacterium]
MLLSINIETEQPIWLVTVCLLLGFLYAYFLYKKDARFDEVKPLIKKTMFGARFVLIALLSFLLLSPFIQTLFNKTEKPIIIFAQDNSASILMNKDSAFYTTTYQTKIDDFINKLAENFQVRKFTFGEELKDENTIDFSEKITNLSAVFEQIESKFYNQNVGAVILASDGIYNQGVNPAYQTNSSMYSVYSLALGDTAVKRDVVLKEVNHNKITFLKNQFPFEVFGLAKKAKGQKTRLKITHNNTILYSKDYLIENDNYSISETILLDAKQVGTQQYRIELQSIDGETTLSNNVKDVFVEVLDGRQRVLILAHAPHPDIKALKQSIESNENYQVTNQLINEFDGNTKPYSLVILHQVAENNVALKSIAESSLSVWYIVGAQSNESVFNQINLGIKVNKSRGVFNDILPKVDTQFPLFTLSEQTQNTIKNFPPLLGFFGEYELKNNGYQLLNQKIGSVETNNPLFVFFQQNDKKIAVLFGEGIWKWRMQEFLMNKNNDATNELINKAVQFLSVKDDKSKFRIIYDNSYHENEELIIKAELYNDSYELINEPEVKLTVENSDNKKFNFLFNKTTKAYFLNAGLLPPGAYHFVAETVYGEKKYTQKGKFQVLPLVLEANNTTADFQVLSNIAQKHGGKMFLPSQLDELAAEIEQNKNISSIIYEEQSIKDLINLKWIFFILLILLTLEWFLRKQQGAY